MDAVAPPEVSPPPPAWPPTPPALALLSRLYGAVGGFGVGRALLARPEIRRRVRRWLLRVVAEERVQPDEVTVLIGIRDRTDYRLANALRSIRAQVVPGGRARAMVIDYGSVPEHALHTRALCEEFAATYVRLPRTPVWSRARCMNEGLRRVRTPFVMTSDADILLSPGYLKEAVRVLRRRPLSVVCSPMLDLPEASTSETRRAAREREPLPLQRWRARTTPRLGWGHHPSIAVGYTAFYRLVRGYDEFYEGWGEEDLDLLERFERLGLDAVRPGADVFYLHQWHPKHENLEAEERDEAIARNLAYRSSHHSIVRNDGGNVRRPRRRTRD